MNACEIVFASQEVKTGQKSDEIGKNAGATREEESDAGAIVAAVYPE